MVYDLMPFSHFLSLQLVAAASLYLGCKLCETPRRIRDVVHIVVFLDWVEKKDEFLEILKKKQQLNNGAAEFSESLKDDEIKQPIFETSNQIETQTNSINAEELNIDSKLALYQVEQISVMLRNMEKEIHLPDINSKVKKKRFSIFCECRCLTSNIRSSSIYDFFCSSQGISANQNQHSSGRTSHTT